jgi:hypothetical protein
MEAMGVLQALGVCALEDISPYLEGEIAWKNSCSKESGEC